MAHTDRSVLLSKLDEAKTQVEVGAKYQHTKSGGLYVVIDLAIQEDTEEVKVIYKEVGQDPSITWDRPLLGEDGWLTPTEIDGKPVERFTKLH